MNQFGTENLHTGRGMQSRPKRSFAPAWSVVGGRHAGNYWEGYSLKLGRVVQFYSDLEYDHWVLVESDPNVEDFCEQPVIVSGWLDGRIVESRIDFWLRQRNGTELFRGVRYDRDITGPTRRMGPQRSVQIERDWALRNGERYEVVTEIRIRAHPALLQNWKRVLHYLRTHRTECSIHGGEELVRSRFATASAISMEALVRDMHPAVSREAARLLIFRHLHAGVLEADMATTCFGDNTIFKLRST